MLTMNNDSDAKPMYASVTTTDTGKSGGKQLLCMVSKAVTISSPFLPLFRFVMCICILSLVIDLQKQDSDFLLIEIMNLDKALAETNAVQQEVQSIQTALTAISPLMDEFTRLLTSESTVANSRWSVLNITEQLELMELLLLPLSFDVSSANQVFKANQTIIKNLLVAMNQNLSLLISNVTSEMKTAIQNEVSSVESTVSTVSNTSLSRLRKFQQLAINQSALVQTVIDRLQLNTLRTLKTCKFPEIQCPSGQVLFRNSCFFFSDQKATWDQAERQCLRIGGRMVSVADSAEQFFLEKAARKENCEKHNNSTWWIGLRLVNDARWEWLESGAVYHINVTKWNLWSSPSTASALGNVCGSLTFTSCASFAEWSENDCETANNFICRLDA